MTGYLIYPKVDDQYNFPEEVRQQLANSSEITSKISQQVASIDLSDRVTAGLDSASSQQSSSGFLRFAGTVPGSVPVVKPQGDDRAGVWEMTNDGTNYIFHLLLGQHADHNNTALIALGVDNDGIGLLIPNKIHGRGIVGDQRATVTDTQAYWLHATQRSPGSSLVRLEQQADATAPVLDIAAFNVTSAGKLLKLSDTTGNEALNVSALNGRLSSYRNLVVWGNSYGAGSDSSIDVMDKTSVATSYYPDATAAPTSHSTFTRHTKTGFLWFSDTGTNNSWYPFAFVANGQYLQLKLAAAGNYTKIDTTGAGASTVAMSLSNGAGFSFYSGKLKVDSVGVGFYGAATKAQPARIGALTDSSGGTSAGATVPAVTDFPSAANAIATLVAKINQLEALLSAAAGGNGLTA